MKKEKMTLKEKASNFFDNPIVVEILIGMAFANGIAAFGYVCHVNGMRIGKRKMLDLVNSNAQSIIHAAYDAGMDGLKESIEENIPEAAEIISNYAEQHPEWCTTIGDAVVNFVEGTFYLK